MKVYIKVLYVGAPGLQVGETWGYMSIYLENGNSCSFAFGVCSVVVICTLPLFPKKIPGLQELCVE